MKRSEKVHKKTYSICIIDKVQTRRLMPQPTEQRTQSNERVRTRPLSLSAKGAKTCITTRAHMSVIQLL